MKVTGLFLAPLDQLFFRDGRAFGASTRVVSGLPNSTTLTGALRTLLLNAHEANFRKLAHALRTGASMDRAFEAAGAPAWIARLRVRGPWLARLQKNKPPELFLRPPKHLRAGPGNKRLPALPLREPLPGWSDSRNLSPLWCAESLHDKENGSRGDLIRLSALDECLNGRPVSETAFERSSNLYSFEDKTGIAIEPDRLTASESMIYAVRMLCLMEGAGFYCEVHSEQPLEIANPSLFPFGGESRYVQATRTDLVGWPHTPQSDRRLFYLLSPGIFAHTWHPDYSPSGANLSAASVDGPFAVSGWDLARGGPKPTRFGVQPGSVYFYEGGAAFSHSSLCADPADALQGYGDFLQGAWNYV